MARKREKLRPGEFDDMYVTEGIFHTGAGLVIMFSDDIDEAYKRLEKNLGPLHKKAKNNFRRSYGCYEDCTAMCWAFNTAKNKDWYILVLIKDKYKNKYVSHLAHELVHASWKVAKHYGDLFNEDANEGQAYFMCSTLERFEQYLKRVKNTVKAPKKGKKGQKRTIKKLK